MDKSLIFDENAYSVKVIMSARKELEKGTDISEYNWFTIKDGQIVSLDWDGYIKYRTRMKPVPAFDSITI